MELTKSFQLQETELRAGLQLSGQLGDFRKKQKAQLTGLAIGFLLFVYCLAGDPANVFYYAVCGLCVVLAAYVFFYPRWREKKDIKLEAEGYSVSVAMRAEDMTICNLKKETQREIEYTSIYGVKQDAEVFVLTLPDTMCVIIPKRIFEPDELAFAKDCFKKAEL